MNLMGMLPIKVKSLHVHAVIDVPGKDDTHLDLKVDDPDDDGDPNYTVKWDLPGSVLDSGAEGLTGEIPVMSLVGPIIGTLITAAASVAPAAARPLLGAIKIVADMMDDEA